MAANHAPNPPQDIGAFSAYFNQCQLVILFTVAIFHASFHPIRGNILDWSLKAADGISFTPLYTSMLSLRIELPRCTTRWRGIQRIT